MFISVLLLTGCGRNTYNDDWAKENTSHSSSTQSELPPSISGDASSGIVSDEAVGTPVENTTPVSGTTSSTTNTQTSATKTITSEWKSYNVPRGQEHVKVTATINTKDNTIASVNVTYQPTDEGPSKRFQNFFSQGISSAVVGKPLSQARVGIVNGSSLTGKGFNDAINQITSEYNAS